MKFYVRESKQDQYYYQSYDQPRVISVYQIKPNDTWCSLQADYHIDKVTYWTGYVQVYATKTILSKTRKYSFYREGLPSRTDKQNWNVDVEVCVRPLITQ